jgi:hypothetical protein
MPWRGPLQRGEFPTLGYIIGDWIETNCIVPDGLRMGEPYLLTDEMWKHLIWSYRLQPNARQDDGADAFVYAGSQLMRPQKWGKDPFIATRCIVHALGPCIFAGWDAKGEPVAKEHPSPWIAVAATADTQTANTYRPIVTMLNDGPLAHTPGLDVGDTRVKLPGIGWIDPVTSSARARLGGRFTFVSITESGLLLGEGPTGGVKFARVLKRNVAGMGGQWTEATNAYDPTEASVAQRTMEARAADVFVDYRPPRRKIPLDDDDALMNEVVYLYGDSARINGGWVSERRIVADIQRADTGEGDARRFFLNEITAGGKLAVEAERWHKLANDETPLMPGEAIALGFDGSRTRDCTALRACRIRDGRLFHIRIWNPADYEGKIPRLKVDQAVRDTFDAYDVHYLFADPYLWQDYLDVWAGLFPKRVVEFATNAEQRMDKAIRRFMTAYRAGELSHDGDKLSTEHAFNAVLAKGKKKPAREQEDPDGAPEHYLKIEKKREGVHIDDFIAGILAYEARGQAIEDGALVDDDQPFFAAWR